METRTDAELVDEALAGRKEAFAALVRKYQDYAYGTAIGMLSDFELARDVVQETFLCAYRDLRNLRDPNRFGGWLHGIVRHTAHRALRELERVRRMAEELRRTVGPAARTPRPDEHTEENERRRIVREALDRLGPTNREAVSLYYVDGLSYAEIAGFLGVTEAAVQGRLQRGRAQLRKELLAMVDKTFKEHELPEDFSAEIQRLLDSATESAAERERAIKHLAGIGPPAVQPLCEALGDPRIPVRRAAARALCAIGDERALRPILRVLFAKDYWIANVLLRTGRVLGIPGARQEMLKIAREGEPAHQYWAIQALAHAKGDQEVFDVLLATFRDRSSPGRGQALWALCRIRPDAALDLLVEALNDADPKLRGRAGWTALSNDLLPPLEACLKAFGGQISPAQRWCAGRLALKHGEAGREALEQLLGEGSRVERTAAAVGLAPTGHGEAFNVLMSELLNDPRDRKWARVVSHALARHYGPRVVEWVQAEGPRLADAHALLWTLARSPRPQTTAAIEELFGKGTPAVRAAALRILARQRGTALVPELWRCLRDGRPRKVAQEAFRQMLRLGEAAAPTVKEMLTSKHWTERKAALCLLRRWGRLTPRQKAQAAKDPHVAVRHAAEWHPTAREAARWHPKWARRISGRK